MKWLRGPFEGPKAVLEYGWEIWGARILSELFKTFNL